MRTRTIHFTVQCTYEQECLEENVDFLKRFEDSFDEFPKSILNNVTYAKLTDTWLKGVIG